MEKAKAIDLLNEYLQEATLLKNRHWNNTDYDLWRDKVLYVLEAAFGLGSPDYDRFERARSISFGGSEHQRDYINELEMRETALKSILLKYKILRTGLKPKKKRDASKRKGLGEIGKSEKQNPIDELRNFYKKLKNYQSRQLNKVNNGSSVAKDRSLNALRLELQREYGRVSYSITSHKGCALIPHSEDMNVIFSVALDSINMSSNAFMSLELALSIVNTAIGVFESDAKSLEIEKSSPQNNVSSNVKIFISHGRGGGALVKLERFIAELGVIPIVVKDQPNLDRSVDKKVEDYLNEANFVIILATGDDELTSKPGTKQPRQNVMHEIGLAQKTHPGKIIYLVEKGVEFPSNVKPKVYTEFVRQSMDEAFTAIVREMRELGFLKATTPLK